MGGGKRHAAMWWHISIGQCQTDKAASPTPPHTHTALFPFPPTLLRLPLFYSLLFSLWLLSNCEEEARSKQGASIPRGSQQARRLGGWVGECLCSTVSGWVSARSSRKVWWGGRVRGREGVEPPSWLQLWLLCPHAAPKWASIPWTSGQVRCCRLLVLAEGLLLEVGCGRWVVVRRSSCGKLCPLVAARPVLCRTDHWFDVSPSLLVCLSRFCFSGCKLWCWRCFCRQFSFSGKGSFVSRCSSKARGWETMCVCVSLSVCIFFRRKENERMVWWMVSGILASADVPTVADTKAAFVRAYRKPIPSIYSGVIQEILVQQHLLRYNATYTYDAVFALGFVTVYDQLMDGYPNDKDRDAIFKAYVTALKEDPELYRFLTASPLSSFFF